MSDCIFCRIVKKEIPANIIYEDDFVLAFEDIHPQAPVHLLAIPKPHIESLAHSKSEHQSLLGHLMVKIPEIARLKDLNNGFRTIFNTGTIGGQEVYHIHAHILGSSTSLPRMMSSIHS
ncbi:MAG: histidine triad nucleotide-binding protein [Pseudomonadota bacterium]